MVEDQLNLTCPCSSADQVHRHRGILDHLPVLYVGTDSESCLHAALGAVAYANFCRRSSMPLEDGRRLAKQYYGRALSLVSKATKSSITACSDDVVVAVSLLGIYEVSISIAE
jgi:hypothetical protein